MPSTAASGRGRMKSKLIRLLVLILVIAGIGLAVLYREHLDAAALEQWVKQAGIAGPLLFMTIYAVGTVFFLPGSVLTLAGGAIFGPVWGTLYNLTGASLGAGIAFIIARYLASDWVERKSGGHLKQLKQGVEGEGWRFVAFVRLVPLFPFNVLNYALGLTKIHFSHYLIASYICMLPGAIAYTYLGYVGREAAAGGEGLIQKGLLGLSLLAVVAFIPSLIARLRMGPMLSVQELQTKLAQDNAPLILDVRTREEFAGEQGHIHAALNIPVAELKQRIDELEIHLERPIAIVCRTDRRSAKAARELGKRGFGDVHVVRGGMRDWNARGFAVERK